MTTKVTTQAPDTVSNPVGKQVNVPLMRTRPPLPLLRNGVTVKSKSATHTGNSDARNFSRPPVKNHRQTIQKSPISNGGKRERRKSSPSATRQNLCLESTDDEEEQDIKFINIPDSTPVSSSLSDQPNAPTYSIEPEELLKQSQETDYLKVYEIILHASDIAEIKNLELFKKIRSLDLSCNKIERLKNLENNQDLRELKLFDNQIKAIENLDRLKELSCLQLQHNRIRNIGKGLSQLKKLKTLRLDSNQILKIEPGELAGCSQITTLDISANMLENLNALNSLPNLEELHATNNRLKAIGDLGRCKKLKEVDVSHNRLSNITGLKGLPVLQSLNVSNNQLTSVKEIGKSKSLQELFLNDNRLESISSFPDQFPNLQILNIADNKLKQVTNVLGLKNVPSLVELYVSGNPVAENATSQEISSKLKGLEILDGVSLRRLSGKSTVPLMRPMSASSVVSVRYIENQMKSMSDELEAFQTSFSQRFESLKSVYESLPSESPTRPPSRPISEEQRPSTSRCSSRSKIKLAQEFAAAQEMGLTCERT